jgi:hypothetical protein
MKTNVTVRLCEEAVGNSASLPRDFGLEFQPNKHRILKIDHAHFHILLNS